MGRYRINGVHVSYIIDRKGDSIPVNIPVYNLQRDSFPKVDIVVVSVIDQYTQIYDTLREKKVCNIVSIESIIKES